MLGGPVSSKATNAAGFAILATVLVFTTSTDLYVATLPMVRDSFDASRQAAEATLPLNFAGFAMGTLVHGVAADRFGRRPVLLTSLCLFVLASLICAMAPSIMWLAIGRVMQGFAAASGTVLVTVLLRELFDPLPARRWVSAYSGAIAVGPSLAPFLGAVIGQMFGWRVNFTVLAICAALAALWFASKVPEPRNRTARLGNAADIRAAVARLMRNRAFVCYSLIGSGALSGIFAFITGAPFLFMEDLGFSPFAYGIIQGGLAACYVVGVVLNGVASGRVSASRILRAGMIFAVVGIAVLWSIVIRPTADTLGVILAISMCTFGLGLLMSNAWYLTYEHIAKDDYAIGGTVSGIIEWTMVTVFSSLVVFITASPLLVLVLVMSACATLIAVCYVTVSRTLPQRPPA